MGERAAQPGWKAYFPLNLEFAAESIPFDRTAFLELEQSGRTS